MLFGLWGALDYLEPCFCNIFWFCNFWGDDWDMTDSIWLYFCKFVQTFWSQKIIPLLQVEHLNGLFLCTNSMWAETLDFNKNPLSQTVHLNCSASCFDGIFLMNMIKKWVFIFLLIHKLHYHCFIIKLWFKNFVTSL